MTSRNKIITIIIIIAILILGGIAGFVYYQMNSIKTVVVPESNFSQNTSEETEEPTETASDTTTTEIIDDADNDGLSKEDEENLGTDPNDIDSDNDGYSDGTEVAGKFDPLSAPAEGTTTNKGFTDEVVKKVDFRALNGNGASGNAHIDKFQEEYYLRFELTNLPISGNRNFIPLVSSAGITLLLSEFTAENDGTSLQDIVLTGEDPLTKDVLKTVKIYPAFSMSAVTSLDNLPTEAILEANF